MITTLSHPIAEIKRAQEGIGPEKQVPAPSCDGMSRMMREYHVRFCEGLGVKFPGPTRHNRKSSEVAETSAFGVRAEVNFGSLDVRS